jgi:uncharacterized membrane protein
VLPSNVGLPLAGEEAAGYGPLYVEPPEPTVTGSYAHSWRQLRRHFFALLAVTFFWMLINVALFAASWLAREGQGEPASSLVDLASVLVTAPLSYGLGYAYLRAARGEAPQVGDLFAPFRHAYLASLLASALYGLLVALGMLLLIVPGIIVAVRLSFAPFLLIDEGLGPVEVLRESWRRTTGYGWTIFGVGLLGIPIFFLGLLLLVVGVIPALMLVELAMASLVVGASVRRYDDE